MRKLVLLFILIYCTCFKSLAQNTAADSLSSLLGTEKSDTTRVNLMIQLARAYLNSRPDTSMLIASQSLELSHKINYKQGEVHSLRLIGNVFTNTGNYPAALETSFKALKIAEDIRDNRAVARLLSLISDVYFYEADLKRSIDYAHKAIVISKKLNDSLQLATSYANLGDSYEKINQLDSALFYTKKAYALSKSLNYIDITGIVLVNLGNIFLKADKPDSAMIFYRLGIPYLNQTNSDYGLTESYLGIATIFRKQHKTDSLLYYAKLSYTLANELGYPNKVLVASHFLADYYKSIRNIDSAYAYQSAAITAKDSLFSQQKANQIQSLTFDEAIRRQQVDEAREQARLRIKQNALVGGLSTLFLVAFLLYRNNRQKQKANKILANTLTDLKSTQSQLIQSEKMASLGELTAGIAHEIQNPLNFMNNFSEVNKELLEEMKDELDKGNTPEAKTIADDVIKNEEKINHHGKRADAIVKGMLQHSRSSSGVKEPTDINALCDEYLRLSYHGLRAKDKSFNATMKTDFDTSIGKINIIPQDIGRVILNLLTNAFYAVDEKKKSGVDARLNDEVGQGYEPAVTIATRYIQPPSGGRTVEIKVSDNGGGIPQKVLDKIFQPFFTTKPTGQGTGLGLSLSYDIITKGHGGNLTVETLSAEAAAQAGKEGEGLSAEALAQAGSTFTIQIPISQV